MDKKENNIITVIAILVIIFGISSSYAIFVSLQSYIKIQTKNFIYPRLMLFSIPLLLLIVAGMGLLFKYHWGRLSTVLLLAYNLVTTLGNKYSIGTIKGVVAFLLKCVSSEELTSWDKAFIPHAIYLIAWLIIEILIIYYLTRPKVKEQFIRNQLQYIKLGTANSKKR